MEKLFVIIPIWGKPYVERFCRRGLPSLLASGNLPQLEESGCEWKLVFASPRKDGDLIREAIQPFGLEEQIELLPIDDLMWGSYGVILTAAYAKGIESCWKEGENTTFMFSNADFLFSNGSIANAYQRISEGNGAVYCPSLRCVDTPNLDETCQRWSEENGNGFTSFELAQFAMAEPHPTVIGSVLNGIDELQRLGTHQIFWQVGDDGLIGSWFLQFMFMVRPQRKLEKLHCFVDYSLIPQLLEDGKFYSPASSEEMFILEPTELDYEILDINILEEASSEKEALMVKDLAFWTTAVHRELGKKMYSVAAQEDFKPSDEAVSEFRERLQSITEKVDRKPPKNTASHYYWRVYMDRLMPWLPADCALRDYLESPALSWSQRLSLNWGAGIARKLFRGIETNLDEIATEPSLLITNLRWLYHLHHDGRGKISQCELLGTRLGPIPARGHVVLARKLEDKMMEMARTLTEDGQCESLSVVFLIGSGGFRLRNKFRAKIIRQVSRAEASHAGLSAFPADLLRFWEKIYLQNYLVRTIGERFRFFAAFCFHLHPFLSNRFKRWLSRMGYGKRKGRGNISVMFWAKNFDRKDLDSLFPSAAFAPRRGAPD